tara:strand:- start:123663 stop:124202 length:540 start_codon:yes stop_codon:yes gene_type:complete
MQGLASFVFHKILGWKVEGRLSPEIKKSVIIVLPHTSWHDFYIGALVRKVIGLPINFVAKKELFKPPFGWYFKWMGGAPIDRSSKQNKVQEVVAVFEKHNEFRLAIAPEGTRKKVEKWRSGFYYIALEARIPIICVAFDYGSKTVKIRDAFYPTGNYENDLKVLKSFYKNVVGKVKAYT